MSDIFSAMEMQILEIIGRDKHKTITEITDHYYDDEDVDVPIYASTVVSTAIKRINAKCEHHDLPWFLNGMGAGRAGRVVWKDKRQMRRREKK